MKILTQESEPPARRSRGPDDDLRSSAASINRYLFNFQIEFRRNRTCSSSDFDTNTLAALSGYPVEPSPPIDQSDTESMTLLLQGFWRNI